MLVLVLGVWVVRVMLAFLRRVGREAACAWEPSGVRRDAHRYPVGLSALGSRISLMRTQKLSFSTRTSPRAT